MKIHVVRRGETLWGIAQQYGVSISEIVTANQVEYPNQLVDGLALLIHKPSNIHIVAPGENLSYIAKIYGTTVQAIIRMNRIQNPDLVHPGTVLFIPLNKPEIEVNSNTNVEGEAGSKQIEEFGRYLTYWSAFAYLIKEDGGLIPIN